MDGVNATAKMAEWIEQMVQVEPEPAPELQAGLDAAEADYLAEVIDFEEYAARASALQKAMFFGAVVRCGHLTGRKNKRGHLCMGVTFGFKCPTHDSDLSARNAKVAANAAKKQERREQLSEWGRQGFAAAADAHGQDFAYQRLVAWKREHPSGPEKMVRDFLEENMVRGLKYEYEVLAHPEDNNPFPERLDIVKPKARRFIQIDGWRHVPGVFGLTDMQRQVHLDQYRRLWSEMEALGWQGLEIIYDPRSEQLEEDWEFKVLSFLETGDTSPFVEEMV
ncbi:MAG: hypothetical protein FOGNACKC_00835 [Anaerolineae bacterium]|nr:hypothetical protein [Anaerolineae bacterium]